MADLSKVHPLGDLSLLGGYDDATKDVTLGVRHGCAMVQIFARKGQDAELVKKLKIGSEAGKASETRAFTALPLSPGQWMLISKKPATTEFGNGIAKKVKGVGYVSEQSDSRVCFRVSGLKARDLMSRGCRLDLHSKDAKKGFCAQTPIAQVGVLLHQVDDAPTYDLYVYSGFARSFWHWLTHTAAQFEHAVKIDTP